MRYIKKQLILTDSIGFQKSHLLTGAIVSFQLPAAFAFAQCAMSGLVAEPRAAHVGEIVAATIPAEEEETGGFQAQVILPGKIPVGKGIVNLEGLLHAVEGMEAVSIHLNVGKVLAKEAGAAQGARSAIIGAGVNVFGGEGALGLFHHGVGIATHGRHVKAPAMTSAIVLISKQVVFLIAADVPVVVIGIEVIGGIIRAEEHLGLGGENGAFAADGLGAGAVIHGSDVDGAAIGGRMGHGKAAVRKDDHLLALLDDVVNGARRGGDGQNQRGERTEDDLGQKILRLLGLFLGPLLVDGIAEGKEDIVVDFDRRPSLVVDNAEVGGLALDVDDGLVRHAGFRRGRGGVTVAGQHVSMFELTLRRVVFFAVLLCRRSGNRSGNHTERKKYLSL